LNRPTKLAASYSSVLAALRGCCKRIEGSRSSGSLRVVDCDLLYESTFLTAIGRLEGVLETLLEEFVNGEKSRKPQRYALVRPKTRAAYRTLLLQGRKYIDVLPFNYFLDITKRYLNQGHPFTDIDATDQQLLVQAVLVRNAIAHRSSYALVKFRATVPGVTSLASHRQLPGPFLRRTYKAFPLQTYLDLYLDTFEKVAQTVAKAW
jgi:hypothetical protein